MIKLEMEMYDMIKYKYIKNILGKILSKKTEQKEIIKFFNNLDVDDFFEAEGEKNNEKIKNILLMDFCNIDKNDQLLVNYFKTGQLIYYSNFNIDKVLENKKEEKCKNNRIKYRRDYVNKYNNPWIEDYVVNHDNIFDSNKKFYEFIKVVKENFNNLNKQIENHIDYSFLSPNLRHEILTSANISVCPYCNRQYISYYFDNHDNKKTTADLDHFYPKSLFPLFSLSLYNFIPSCQICNQRMKKNKVKKILYPFKDEYGDDAKFTLNIHSIDGYYCEPNQMDINLDIDDNAENYEAIKNDMEMFKIKSLYQHHKGYISEIMLKNNVMYTDSYLEIMKKTFKDLNLSKRDLELALYDFSLDEEIHLDQRTLGKLTRDILEFFNDEEKYKNKVKYLK